MDILGSWRVQLFLHPTQAVTAGGGVCVLCVLSASENQAEETQKVGRGLCSAKANTGLWVPQPVVCLDCATQELMSLGFFVLLRHYRAGSCGVGR